MPYHIFDDAKSDANIDMYINIIFSSNILAKKLKIHWALTPTLMLNLICVVVPLAFFFFKYFVEVGVRLASG